MTNLGRTAWIRPAGLLGLALFGCAACTTAVESPTVGANSGEPTVAPAATTNTPAEVVIDHLPTIEHSAPADGWWGCPSTSVAASGDAESQHGFRPMASASTAGLLGRTSHSALWASGQMIVWGGTGDGAIYGDGAAYDPAKDAWRKLPVAPLSARMRHAAVWTGREMIVWGGHDPQLAPHSKGDGAVFDACSGKWSMMADAPIAARSLPVAVWSTTTRELIVWGGEHARPDVGALYSDGAAYDPATNHWRVIAASPLSARAWAGAVWNGSAMIVYGGGVGGDALASDAASYDPHTDRWTAIATPKGAAGRANHLAVATGPSAHDAAFWGGVPASNGEESTTSLDDGLIYRAETASWVTIPSPAKDVLPGGGRIEAAAWSSGGALYVWGGLQGFDQFASGASFDPTTGKWTAMPKIGAPSARYGATAVWTGREALVFGGVSFTDGDIYRSDGAAFRP